MSLRSAKPDATKHDPRPEYLRELVDQSGLSQQRCAVAIGVSARAMRYYLSDGANCRVAPYPVQFALEALARR